VVADAFVVATVDGAAATVDDVVATVDDVVATVDDVVGTVVDLADGQNGACISCPVIQQ